MADSRTPQFNKVFLAGNLTRDPEMKYLESGTAVCDLGLASNRRYRTADGEQREEVLFMNLTVWGKSAEYAAANLRKGHPVLVEGRLKQSVWGEGKERREKIEISVDNIEQLSWTDDGGPKPKLSGAGVTEPTEDELKF